MKKILLLIPHPDDEIVGTSAIVQRKKNQGCSFFFFFLTNGVLKKNEMWPWNRKNYENLLNIRINEMKKSLNLFEVNEFCLQNIPTRQLKYFIKPTIDKISKLISKYKIDSIFTPAYEGGHQDHDVTNCIASIFKKRLNIFEYSEYNYYQNKINSNTFIKKTGNEICYQLTNKEVEFKRKALNIYCSEKNNLNYINLKQECYRPLTNYDYNLPPHEGLLFYRRFSLFSWHPRVDSSHPREICKILNEVN